MKVFVIDEVASTKLTYWGFYFLFSRPVLVQLLAEVIVQNVLLCLYLGYRNMGFGVAIRNDPNPRL